MGIKRTVSIRQIDLWGSEPLESKKKAKNAKNWNVNFSFVFLDECLCKKDHNFRHGSGPRISISFFASVHLNPTAHFWPWDKYFCEKKYFSAHPTEHSGISSLNSPRLSSSSLLPARLWPWSSPLYSTPALILVGRKVMTVVQVGRNADKEG